MKLGKWLLGMTGEGRISATAFLKHQMEELSFRSQCLPSVFSQPTAP